MRPDAYLATANAVICNVTWRSSEILVGTICLTDGAYLHCIAGSSLTQSFSSNNVFFCKFWCFTQPDSENYHLSSVAWNTCIHQKFLNEQHIRHVRYGEEGAETELAVAAS